MESAMGNFYTDVISKDPRFHSTNDCRDLAMLEPVTRAAVLAIIADAKAQGIELIVTETFRSQARQADLYAQGLTELQHVGTHGFGVATDFAKIVDGKANWGGDWQFLCVLAKKHGLLSGLDWGQPGVHHDF